MRIALVTESFYPAFDGTTTTVKAVADRLVDARHEVSLMALAPGLTSYRGCRVVRITPDGLGARVRTALEDLHPDLVHVLSPGRVGRKALKYAERLGVPSLVVQQTPLRGIATDYWHAKVADRADRVLATSSWLAAELEQLGVRAPVWTPGVDTRAFTPALRDPQLHAHWSRTGRPEGPLVVVGYVGSLHKCHGVRRLAALARIPGVRLVVVGDGPERGWLQDRLPRAKFTGELTNGDLATAMASLDVLVHPGETESGCHSLREAAASGVPVVAPRAGGAPDAVRHLENGLLFGPRNDVALTDAVAALVADPRRKLLGDRGRELALTRSWSDAVDELLLDHYPRAIWRRHPAA
ncbi:MAG: glycosyltransferase [Nocardioides sp.]